MMTIALSLLMLWIWLIFTISRIKIHVMQLSQQIHCDGLKAGKFAFSS